jgi:hypothetical protein
VINYLDAQQRAEKSQDPQHENKTSIAYFLEEAQNAFNSRSTASSENEEFLSVFNEARNMKEAFFTSSQRLNDFSKTIRSKQLLAIGKLSNEDINPFLHKIEKSKGLDFANMTPRKWFFEGKTFLSPEFKQQGKPQQINEDIKKKWLSMLPKKKTFAQKVLDWIHNKQTTNPVLNKQKRTTSSSALNEDGSENEDEKEDSQGDGLMLGFGDLFPEDY